jgi:ADP-heptose:LPS heptosyltransferase
MRGLIADRIHQALKRAQRRYLIADYEDLRLRERWLRRDPSAPFEEHVFPVRPDPEKVRTVLVFKADEIGDAIHVLPAVGELRRWAPHARFSLVCRPLTKSLYERAGLFDAIATFEPGSRLIPAGRRARRAARTLGATEFDLAVFPKSNPATFREFLAVPARARLHPLDPRMRSSSVYRAQISMWGDERRHQAIQMLELVSLLTGKTYSFGDVVYPDFAWTRDDRAALPLVFGSEQPPPFLVIHPFAKDETRRYPADYWTELLDALGADLGLPIVSIGAAGDGTLPERPDLLQSQGRLTLTQTGYLLSRASGFVGNLSGPAHWTAALGVPTVTLMSGHSLPVEWAPLGTSLVLRADVPCAPCHQRTCPVYGLACLTELTPERVRPRIVHFLRENLAERPARPAEATSALRASRTP